MGKVVLITGASSGIGRETAILLKQAGFTVYGASRNMEKLQALKGRGITILPLDVTVEESIQECIKAIIQKEGRIDVLINNAGYGSFGALEDVPLSEARNQYDVNVFGLARITQLALPYMRSQRYGRIVNVSSVGGIITTPFGGWYQSSKHAIESLSDALRLDTRGFGIDIIVIEPSNIETGFESVAIERLRKSTSVVYKKKADSFIKGLSKSYEGVSKPDVIAKTIKKAVTAKRPKTRYVAGKMSRTIVFLKALLTDRQFDRLMINTFIK